MNRRVTRIDELAQDLPPSRDLWPDIAQAIAEEPRGISVVTTARPTAWRRPAYLAAAAAVLMAFGVFIGVKVAPTPVVPVANETTTNADPSFLPASLRDAAYRKQRTELLSQVQVRLNAMPAAERDKVAASLATLQRSITEIEAALGRDPANALLQELLVNSSQEEMRALTVVRDSGSQEI
jgi:N-acyl-D-aspartate/D-glutamate deacylase